MKHVDKKRTGENKLVSFCVFCCSGVGLFFEFLFLGNLIYDPCFVTLSVIYLAFGGWLPCLFPYFFIALIILVSVA